MLVGPCYLGNELVAFRERKDYREALFGFHVVYDQRDLDYPSCEIGGKGLLELLFIHVLIVLYEF